MVSETGSSKLTIVYDNNPFDPRLKPARGFACWIETGKTTILFDAGGDPTILMSNLSVLGLNPKQIDTIVLSHNHNDHMTGLDALLLYCPFVEVFFPAAFPYETEEHLGKCNYVVPVSKSFLITECCRTTGEMGHTVVEQSLIVQTSKGLIVVTGSAHPGICEIVQKAKMYGDVFMVVGGFDLSAKSSREIEMVVSELRQLGVQKVAPCHCTGEQAIQHFRMRFGVDFIQTGVGTVISVER